jgi:acetolactate synthase-1/3 small subunit
MMQSDIETAERAVQHLEKVIGVRGAIAFPTADGVSRELALVKVRAPHHRHAELLDVIQLYNAEVLDDANDGLIVELSGAEAFVLSCLRALDAFEVVEVVRSGTIALGTANTLQSEAVR